MTRTNTGYALLGIAFIIFLAKYYFVSGTLTNSIFSFAGILMIVASILMIFPFEQIIFDNREWIKNDNLPQLIKKIRLRAVLFNNISVIIFLMAVAVIVIGFYIIIHPQADTQNKPDTENLITIRISATALLIFLVQILFRAFKYLLRVAAFYNAKADAMEVNALISNSDLSKLMDLFTPQYDISDVPTPSFLDKLTGKS
jgi:hypothetical protein